MAVSHYDVNDPWERTATFKVNGVNTDPTAVTAKVRTPAGVVTNYAYPHANLTKDAVGIYRLTGTATEVGRWYYQTAGTGTAAGVEEDYFQVDPSRFDILDELEPYALTTIEDTELFMDRTGVQGTEANEADDLRFIAGLINAYSSAVREYTQRQFKPLETAATKKFSYDGAAYLSLAPYELRAVTSINLYTDLPTSQWSLLVAQTAAVEGSYRLEPRQQTTVGTYLRLQMPAFQLNGALSREVAILGDWGAGVVPADVRMVVEAEVTNAWSRSTGQAVSQDFGEGVLRDTGPFDLSRRSQGILDRHRNY